MYVFKDKLHYINNFDANTKRVPAACDSLLFVGAQVPKIVLQVLDERRRLRIPRPSQPSNQSSAAETSEQKSSQLHVRGLDRGRLFLAVPEPRPLDAHPKTVDNISLSHGIYPVLPS